MIKAIKYGQKRCVTCETCGALLEFEKDDIKTDRRRMNEYEQRIICPTCSGGVTLE